MRNLAIYSPENKEFGIFVTVNMSEKTLRERVADNNDFSIKTIHDSIVVIPAYLKKRLYYKLSKTKEQ